MSDAPEQRGGRTPGLDIRWVYALIGLAFVVSIVHYADNFGSYDEYPLSGTIPNPSKTLIGLSWFGFAGAALAALYFLRRTELRAAAVSIAIFSGSDLVGIVHYTVEGTGDFPWWRHAHIVTDITLGIALASTAIWLIRLESVGGSRRVSEGPR